MHLSPKLLIGLFICCFSCTLLAGDIFAPKTGDDYINQAQNLCGMGLREEAITSIQAAIKIFEARYSANDTSVAYLLKELVHLYYEYGRADSAQAPCQRAYDICKSQFGTGHGITNSYLMELAWIDYMRGRYTEAATKYLRAMEVAQKLKDDSGLAYALMYLGRIYLLQDRNKEADSVLCLAKSDWMSIGDSSWVAFCTNLLGNLALREGDYELAEQRYREALNIRLLWFKNPKEPSLAEQYNNLANLRMILGEEDSVEYFLLRAIWLRERLYGPTYNSLIYPLQNLGDFYCSQNRFQQADLLYDRAFLSIHGQGFNHPFAAWLWLSKAKLYHKMKRDEASERLFLRALRINVDAFGFYHRSVAEALSSLGVFYRYLEKWNIAREAAYQAYEIRFKNFRDLFYILSDRKALLYSKYVKEEAGNYLSILQDAPDSDSDTYREMADVAFSTKGLVSDGVFTRYRNFFSIQDNGLKPLLDSLRLVSERLSDLYTQETKADSYLNDLSQATEDKERIERELAIRSAEFSRELDIWDVNASKIASCLPAGSALLEYFRYEHLGEGGALEPHYLVFVLDWKDRLFSCDLGPAAPIDSLVNCLQSLIKHPEMPMPEDYQSISHEIYTKIWKPIADKTDSANLVFIAPDGALNLISFATLIDDNNKFLIERYPVHYLSSGRDLLRLKDHPASGKGLIAFGDPDSTLPEARKEVRLIRAEWLTQSQEPAAIYLGLEATKARFESEAPGKRVIHFATHGYYDEQVKAISISRDLQHQQDSYIGKNPLLLSGLYLARTNIPNDSNYHDQKSDLLTAEEVSRLNLSGAELVVLSACESGLGTIESCEGVYGLRRAFRMAGARTVISSLWRVSDKETVRLMRNFYSRKGENIARILQEIALEEIQAQRALNQTPDPMSWGAFIALGAWQLQ